MQGSIVVAAIIAVLVIVVLIKTAIVVPQRSEFIVERLGKYNRTLQAGFHILFPFIDSVAYKRSLKEEVIDVPSQSCITADNITLEIDGVLYLQVLNSQKSAYCHVKFQVTDKVWPILPWHHLR